MADEKLPELETTCPDCNGECGGRTGKKWFECYTCNNEGVVVTEFGERVLEFVGKHFKSLLRNCV